MEAVKVRSREDIAALKREWGSDPCWDIEDTEGFEAHRAELVTYRLDMEQEWADNARQEELATAARWGVTVDLVRHITALEERVKTLEGRRDER